MKIRVLCDGERVVIDTKNLDSKKHLHISGREFTTEECKKFKGSKEKEVKVEKKEVKKTEEK